MRAVLTYGLLAATMALATPALAAEPTVVQTQDVNALQLSAGHQNAQPTAADQYLPRVSTDDSVNRQALVSSRSTVGDTISSLAQLLAVLGILTLLHAIKTKPQRLVKMGAEGRRYDPKVRGLFDD